MPEMCRGCGWQLATSDGYCLECAPSDDDGETYENRDFDHEAAIEGDFYEC